MRVSPRRKQSKIVKRCEHKIERERAHMGDIAGQQIVRVFQRQGHRLADRKGGSGPEMTKGLKGGEERWRDNG